MKTYELVNCWPHLRPHNFEGRPFDADCPEDGEIFVKESEAAARIAKLEMLLAESRSANGRWARGMDYVGALEIRIAELEKQAAIDKTLLALAAARINRELRDDFAGRALQGALSSGSFSMLGHPERAKFAYTQADEMLKAKGGA